MSLNRINPSLYDEEYGGFVDCYQDYIDGQFKKHESFYKTTKSIKQAVKGVFFYKYEFDFEENGMNKLLRVVIATLWMIEKGDVDAEILAATLDDIHDFESMDCAELFTPNDYARLVADIQRIKDYASKK